MNIFVLGGYGLIGSEIVRALLAAGHEVTGFGRSRKIGERRLPSAKWVSGDLVRLTTHESWLPYLDSIDAVVNASGALQSDGRTDLGVLQRDAIAALIAACTTAGIKCFAQISAPGADPQADTEFLSTKGEADAILRNSGLEWTIFKPGLVLSPVSYGGTAVIRMAAAFPFVQPVLFSNAPIQTVHVGDVAAAVVRAIETHGLTKQEFDLVEDKPNSLEDTILSVRRWLGFSDPLAVWRLPTGLSGLVGKAADLAGRLGWPSGLRSTSMKVLATGVTGAPAPWTKATGAPLSPLADTLQRIPATPQDAIAARLRLLFPLALVAFSVFWLLSGLIGLLRIDAATAIIADRFGPATSLAFVIAGSLADIAIGIGLLIRPLFAWAAGAAIAVSLGYLILGTLFVPALLVDPLGPLTKIIPVLIVSPMLIAMRSTR